MMKLFLVLALAAFSAAQDLEEDLEERALEEKSTFKPQKHFTADVEIMSSDLSIIASLRETPSELHLCSASFIRQDALLTTARCIYGKLPIHTYIHTHSKTPAGSGVSIPVKSFKPHPHFEISPPVNNIGIIFLKNSYKDAFVHQLPLPWQNHRGTVTIYQWKFGKHNVVFSLHSLIVSLITNAKCSIILKEFVECKYLCVGNQIIHQGSMDQGVPMSGRHNHTTYILGLYNREGPDRSVNAEKYEKVYPHVEWINHVLNNNPKSPPSSLLVETNSTLPIEAMKR